MRKIEKLLKADGFKLNCHGDAWDKGLTRVFFDDNHIHVVRFNNPIAQLVEWNNIVDGNMPLDKQIKIISAMVKL